MRAGFNLSLVATGVTSQTWVKLMSVSGTLNRCPEECSFLLYFQGETQRDREMEGGGREGLEGGGGKGLEAGMGKGWREGSGKGWRGMGKGW